MVPGGIRAHGVKLAGHAENPEALGAVSDANWYESVIDGFERLRAYGDPIVLVGLSMGGVLAARLAVEQGEGLAAIVMLAPASFLSRWTRLALRVIHPATKLADRVYLHKPSGSEIHDAAARRIHPGNRIMPLRAALSLIELSDYVRPKLGDIDQPALLIHARKD